MKKVCSGFLFAVVLGYAQVSGIAPIQTCIVNNGAAQVASATCTWGGGPVRAGDLIYAVVTTAAPGTFSSLTNGGDTFAADPGAGTPITNIRFNGGSNNVSIAYVAGSAGGSTTLTANFSVNAAYAGIYAVEYPGGTVDKSDNGVAGSATLTASSNSITPTQNGELLISVFSGYPPSVTTLGTNVPWASIINTNNGYSVLESYVQPTAAAVTAQFGISATSGTSPFVHIAAFKITGTSPMSISSGVSPQGPPFFPNDQYTGANGWPDNGYHTSGDTFYRAWRSDGVLNISWNDGNGFSNPTGGCSANMGLGTLSADLSQGTVVNCMASMGPKIGYGYGICSSAETWKSAGMIYVNDGSTPTGLYWSAHCMHNGVPWTPAKETIMYSPDNGVTWCQPGHTGAQCNVNGDVPTTGTGEFNTNFFDIQFVQYEKGATGALTTDCQNSYIYAYGGSSDFTTYILGRFARGTNPQVAANWTFFHGAAGADACASGNWQNSSTGATTLLASTGGGINFMPSIVYIQGYGYLTAQNDFNNGLSFLTSQRVTGPWVPQLYEAQIPGNSYNFATPLLSTVSGNTIEVMMGGSYLRDTGTGSTPYSPYFRKLTLGPAAPATVYLRSSGPAAVQVTGATNATPVVVQTAVAHGFSAGDTVVLGNVCSGSGASPVSGIRKVGSVVDATHFSITDLSGTPIAGNGAWCDGSYIGNPGGVQWVGKVTPYTLGAGPLGVLDGTNGNTMRALATGPLNGLTSLVVSGCSGSPASGCLITVTTSYDPTSMSIPVAAGQKFSVTGTGTGATHGPLDSCGAGGGQFSPYTIASASPSGWVSTPFTCNGLTNGTYNGTNLRCGPAATPNDTIGGNQDCVRVSLLAYTGNTMWDIVVSGASYWNLYTSHNFKFVWDGGMEYPSSNGTSGPAAPQNAAVIFMVDQSNSQMLIDLTYFRDNYEKFGGVNWTANEGDSLVNTFWTQAQSTGFYPAAWIYASSSAYWTASATPIFIAKLYNDLDDPTGFVCSKVHANILDPSHYTVLDAGGAQAISAGSITLSSADSQADGYYTNNVIKAANGSYCRVSAYVFSTKVATCAANWGVTPPASTSYTIYASASVSSTATGATAMVTGYNTTFTSSLHVGDGIEISSGFNDDVTDVIMYVSAINSDTSLTVINSAALYYATTAGVPAQVWYLPKWATGDCGLGWLEKHSPGITNAHPVLYPQVGGEESMLGGGPNFGGNFGLGVMVGHLAAGYAMAGADPRVVRDLAVSHSDWFDYELSHYMNYGLGFNHSGSRYAWGTTGVGMAQALLVTTYSVPTFPSMDLANWAYADTAQYKIYTSLPDTQNTGNGPRITPQMWGDEAQVQLELNIFSTQGYLLDPVFAFAPSSANARYLRDWLANKIPSFSLWGGNAVQGNNKPFSLFMNDPRIGTSNHTLLPHQYLFQRSSVASPSLTGWPVNNCRGDAVVSRTGLSTQTDTLLLYQSRCYWEDHDQPLNGELSVYKVGPLLGGDEPNNAFPDAGTTGGASTNNNTVIGNLLQFGGAANFPRGNYSNPPTPGISPITMWASANHGSWATPYGDQNSQYAWVCSNLAGAYTVTPNYAQRCIAHMKPASGEEIIVQWDSASVPAATQIAYHVHYPQNGESATSEYLEGTTTYSGGQVTELEDGGAAANGNPARTYGLLTKFFSPGTITVQDDNTSYTGSNGHTHRISVCGGSSCGSSVSTFEVVTVHKIAENLSDTNLTATALNPDGNWTGVQTTDKVVLLARGGTTHSSITGFTTTHSGTAQYLLGGLTPGTYSVTIGGNPVAGSPFTVSASDNSIEFLSTAGTVSISGAGNLGSATGSAISGQVSAGGNVIIH